MADLTVSTDITGVWKEVSAPLGMTDGKNYLIDFLHLDGRATVYTFDTDSATVAPSDDEGHPLKPPDDYGPIDSRLYTKRADVYLWVRVDRREATMVASAVD